MSVNLLFHFANAAFQSLSDVFRLRPPLLFSGHISFPHYSCCTWGQQMGDTLRPSSARVCVLRNTSGQLGLSPSTIKLLLQLLLLLLSQRKTKEERFKDACFVIYLCGALSTACVRGTPLWPQNKDARARQGCSQHSGAPRAGGTGSHRHI